MINTQSAELVLCEKGFLSETIVGSSMLPLLKEYRDTVIIEKITAPLRRYDVVLFRRGEQLVLHRIVKFKNGYFLIRGDNCTHGEKVCEGQIIGKMTCFYHKGKRCNVNNKAYRLYSIIWVKSHLVYIFFRKIPTVLWWIHRSFCVLFSKKQRNNARKLLRQIKNTEIHK